jgi:hypothetical protein
MTADVRPQRVDLDTRELPGETLVYLPEGDICTINGTARQLWKLCDGERTREQIADAFADLYPDEHRASLVSDALQGLSLLQDAGLIELAEQG